MSPVSLVPSDDPEPERVGDTVSFRDHHQQQVRRASLVDAVCAMQDLEVLVRQGPLDNSVEAVREHTAMYALAIAARVWLSLEPDLDEFVGCVGKLDGLDADDLETRLQVVTRHIRDIISRADPPSRLSQHDRSRARLQSLVDAGAMAFAFETVKHFGFAAIELIRLNLNLPR